MLAPCIEWNFIFIDTRKEWFTMMKQKKINEAIAQMTECEQQTKHCLCDVCVCKMEKWCSYF